MVREGVTVKTIDDGTFEIQIPLFLRSTIRAIPEICQKNLVWISNSKGLNFIPWQVIRLQECSLKSFVSRRRRFFLLEEKITNFFSESDKQQLTTLQTNP